MKLYLGAAEFPTVGSEKVGLGVDQLNAESAWLCPPPFLNAPRPWASEPRIRGRFACAILSMAIANAGCGFRRREDFASPVLPGEQRDPER
jgi:hypothetical protein